MTRTLEAFALDVMNRARPYVHGDAMQAIEDDFRCGEEEAALICALEAAPQLMTARDVEDLKSLMKDFYPVDKVLAQRVLDKASSVAA